MGKETISFQIEAAKRASLDEIAAVLERDRSAVINEALDAYLDLQKWQAEHIRRGLAEAESGIEGVPHEDVFERLRARIEDRLASAKG